MNQPGDVKQAQGSEIDKLIGELKHKDYHVRYKAARALGEMRDVRAIEPLLRAISDFDQADEESKVNRSAAEALAAIGAPAVLPLIGALKPDKQNPQDDWRIYWVCNALGDIQDRRAIEPVIKLLESENATICAGAVEALARMPDRRALKPLTQKLRQFTPEKSYVGKVIQSAIQQIKALP